MNNGNKKAVVKKAALSKEEKEAIAAEVIGVHPKYFVYNGTEIKINVYKMAQDGVNWSGFNA